ncbi:MAG: DUF4199 domain-containing protein [Muribaculaceae bacterium]|nr:DUF4199 domain-containing protein [Muribaculaceae bacterium]
MKRKSIYKYASEAGFPAGIYLTLMSACLLMSVRIPNLVLLELPLAIGFPFVLWALMRKIIKAEPSYTKFASVWLGGIYTVIFGTVICLFLSALYITYVEPGFVGIYVNNALEALEMSPMAGDYQPTITLMHEAIDAHILPSGMEFLTTMAWLTCFSGSVLSLLIALLMTKAGKKITERASA